MAVLARPAFAVSDRTFSWGEVVLAARRWKVWEECELAAHEDLELLAHAAGGEAAAPTEEQLRSREADFRRARGLLSAEELAGWLEQWQLEPRAWRRYLHAEALRAALPGRGVSAAAGSAANGNGAAAALARATWARAVCSGALEHTMKRLAAVAATAGARGAALDDSDELDEQRLAGWDALYESFCQSAPSERALARELELRTIDWTHFELSYLASADEDVIREAALCVREDGMSLKEVGVLARLTLERQSTDLAAVDDSLRSILTGARAGSVLGPLRLGREWRLLEVRERRAPSLTDAQVRERARQASVASAVRAEVMNRVRWYEHG
jgi:hypothetical protein